MLQRAVSAPQIDVLELLRHVSGHAGCELVDPCLPLLFGCRRWSRPQCLA